MTPEKQCVSSWSGKARPNCRKDCGDSQKTPRHRDEDDSPKIAALPLNPQSQEDKETAPTGAMAPETPNIVVTPKSAQRSDKSCMESVSSDGASSIKSDTTTMSQNLRRPSSVSMQRSQATEEGSSDGGSAGSGIKSVNELLSAVKAANAVAVAQILSQCSCRPREAAFTTMIKDCGQDVTKALQLWGAMKNSPKLKANTISYSVLINVCGNAGAWKQAETIFREQIQAAEKDHSCRPNTFTYSNLLTAMLKAKKVDQALQWYRHMKSSEVPADPPLYTNVLSAALDASMGLPDVLGLLYDMHFENLFASERVYIAILKRVAAEMGWGKALEVFLCIGMAGAPVTTEISLTLMRIFGQSGATLQAAQLLHEFMLQDYSLQGKTAMALAALDVYAKAGRHQRSVQLWQGFFKPKGLADTASARLVLEALEKADQAHGNSAIKRELLDYSQSNSKKSNRTSMDTKTG